MVATVAASVDVGGLVWACHVASVLEQSPTCGIGGRVLSSMVLGAMRVSGLAFEPSTVSFLCLTGKADVILSFDHIVWYLSC